MDSHSQTGDRFIVFWFSLLISQDILDYYIFNEQGKLTASDLFPLTFTSKSVSKIVRDYISRNMWFNVELVDYHLEPKEIKTISRFIWYTPTKISSCEEYSFLHLFDNVLPSLSISHLKFHTYNNGWNAPYKIEEKVLPLAKLPRTLTHLEFGDRFDLIIQENDLPASLTHCKFGDSFSHDISHLPRNIVHLIFGNRFNKIVDGLLPPKLRYVEFGVAFSQTIDCLPASVTSVCFRTTVDDLWEEIDGFNSPINSLPSSLTHLELGLNFEQNVDSLPSNLTHLQLRGLFNKPIDHLPDTLLFLGLSDRYNLPVERLPPNLSHLSFGGYFNCPVENLPPTISYLTFGDDFAQKIDSLPLNLTHLAINSIEFNEPIDQLPVKLTHLNINSIKFDQSVDHLPPNLKYLKLSTIFNRSLQNLPPLITHLWLGKDFQHFLPLHLNNIKKLVIKSDYLLSDSLDLFKQGHPSAEIVVTLKLKSRGSIYHDSSSGYHDSTPNKKIEPIWEEFPLKWNFAD